MARLQERISRLEAKLKIVDGLDLDGNVYWKKESDSKKAVLTVHHASKSLTVSFTYIGLDLGRFGVEYDGHWRQKTGKLSPAQNFPLLNGIAEADTLQSVAGQNVDRL